MSLFGRVLLEIQSDPRQLSDLGAVRKWSSSPPPKGEKEEGKKFPRPRKKMGKKEGKKLKSRDTSQGHKPATTVTSTHASSTAPRLRNPSRQPSNALQRRSENFQAFPVTLKYSRQFFYNQDSPVTRGRVIAPPAG